MKKLLSVLAALVLTGSSTSLTVSCSYAPSAKTEADRQAKFYAEVSAQALKPGVLADQNLDIYGKKNAGVDIDFANDYFGGQSITSAFGSLYNPKQGAKPDQTSQVSSLYGSVFGHTSSDALGYHYSVKDSYSSLKSNNGVAKGTNLYDLINGGDNANKRTSQLQKPDSSIASTLNLVSGLGNLVFKNDFDPSIGETLIGLLGTATVQGVLSNKDGSPNSKVAGIFDNINSVLSENGTAISKLIGNITQSDLAAASIKNNWNYQQVLEGQTDNLFGSLIYLISGKKYKFNPTQKSINPQVTKNNLSGLDTFIKFLQAEGSSNPRDAISKLVGNKNDGYGDLAPADSLDNNDYSDLIDSVSGIASFAVTLLHYLRQFDYMFPRRQNTSDGNHIFSDSLTNGDAIAQVLATPYVSNATQIERNGQDNFWYTTDKPDKDENFTFYSKFNLQNLISNLQYYLNPVDDAGHQTLRLFSMLLGGPDGQLGPILESIFDSVDKYKSGISNGIKGALEPITDKVTALQPIVEAIADQIADAVSNLGRTALVDIINWFTTDGYDPFTGSISGIIKQITSILGSISLSAFAPDKSVQKILEIIDGCTRYLDSADGEEFYKHPWAQIYGGSILSAVGRIMKNASQYESDQDLIDDDARIGYGLAKLRDLRTVLTMSFKNLAKVLSVIVNSEAPGSKGYINISVPDILYLANNKSIADIINELATTGFTHTQDGGTDEQKIYDSNAYNTLDQDKFFSFNSRSLSNLVNAIIPGAKGTSGDTHSVRIYKTSENYPNGVAPDDSSLPDGEWVSPVLPIYYAIMNTGSATVKTPGLKGTYIAYVPGEYEENTQKIKGHVILSSSQFNDPDDKKSTFVASKAFHYLLGVDDFSSSSRTMFMQGSLLMAVSNIYGHWYTTERTPSTIKNGKDVVTQTVTSDSVPLDNGETINANALGAESLFSVFADVAQFTNDSITQLTNDVYGQYFDPKNWKVTNIKQHGLQDPNDSSKQLQQLDYNLKFYNTTSKQWVTYHVMMQRNATNMNSIDNDNNTGWSVEELMLQK